MGQSTIRRPSMDEIYNSNNWDSKQVRCDWERQRIGVIKIICMFSITISILWTPPLIYCLEKCQPISSRIPAQYLPFYPSSNLTGRTPLNGLRLRCHRSLHHEIMKSVTVHKKIKAINPVTVTMSNGTQVASNHKCELEIPLLPAAARFRLILSSLSHHSLVLVVKLCKKGCEIKFHDIYCKVRHPGKVGCLVPSTNAMVCGICHWQVQHKHRKELGGRNLVIRAYDQLTTKVFARKRQTKRNQPYDQPSFPAHHSR